MKHLKNTFKGVVLRLFVASKFILGRKKDQFLNNKIIGKKTTFSFVHLHSIRWIWRALLIALFVFTTASPIFAQTITVTAPDGGEIWEVGSIQTITWTSTGTAEKVKTESNLYSKLYRWNRGNDSPAFLRNIHL